MKPRNKYFFIFILVLLSFGVYQIVKDYIPVILLSFTFVLMIRPFYNYLVNKLRFSAPVASAVTVTISLITLILPIVLILNSLIQEGIVLLQGLNLDLTSQASILAFINRLNELLNSIPGINYTITLNQVQSAIESIARPLLSTILSSVIDISSSSINLVTNILLFLIIVLTTLPSLPSILKYLKHLSPLGDEIDSLYLERAISMIKAMIKGTFFVSFVLALIATIALAIIGVPYLITLFILMFIAGILPVIGVPLVTVPVCIWLLLNGQIISTLFLLFIQFVVMVVIDNVLRSTLVAKEAALNPILLILGVIGGVNIFGWIGFIFGPVVMILFVTTLEIYLKYYHPHHSQ